MLTSMFQSSTIPVLEQVLKFTEARHGVLAGNIANIDTPGYRTRDLSPALFQERLKEAVETRHRQPSVSYQSYVGTGNKPVDEQERTKLDAFRKVEESLKDILHHDGTDVSLEQQTNEIVKNQQMHNLAVSVMTAQFRLLRAAITERAA
jgi:flagellar basal-body rod protein FlgB